MDTSSEWRVVTKSFDGKQAYTSNDTNKKNVVSHGKISSPIHFLVSKESEIMRDIKQSSLFTKLIELLKQAMTNSLRNNFILSIRALGLGSISSHQYAYYQFLLLRLVRDEVQAYVTEECTSVRIIQLGIRDPILSKEDKELSNREGFKVVEI